MTVYDLKIGEEGRVEKLLLEGAPLLRLNSLGLKRGVKLRVLAYSLFNGSVLLSFGSVRVSVRRKIAERIEVSA